MIKDRLVAEAAKQHLNPILAELQTFTKRWARAEVSQKYELARSTQEDGDVLEVYGEVLDRAKPLLGLLVLTSDLDYTGMIENVEHMLTRLENSGKESEPGSTTIATCLKDASKFVESLECGGYKGNLLVTLDAVRADLKNALDRFACDSVVQADVRYDARSVLGQVKRFLEMGRSDEVERIKREIEETVCKPVRCLFKEAESVVGIRGRGVPEGTELDKLSSVEKEALYLHYRRSLWRQMPDLKLGKGDPDWVSAARTLRLAIAAVFGVNSNIEASNAEEALTKLLFLLMLGWTGKVAFSELSKEVWSSEVSLNHLRRRLGQGCGREDETRCEETMENYSETRSARPRSGKWWKFW